MAVFLLNVHATHIIEADHAYAVPSYKTMVIKTSDKLPDLLSALSRRNISRRVTAVNVYLDSYHLMIF